jgi:hypothetical protein
LGRQINFYAGPRDMETLTRELRRKWAVVIADRPETPEPVVIYSALPVLDGAIWAWLVREEDLNHIKWGHFPRLGYWVLDQMGSPAVQYLGPGMKNQIMTKGRLWYSPEKSVRCKKPEDFTRWADSLLRVPRKIFSRLPKPKGYSYSVYIGPEAAEMVASGRIILDDANLMPKE